MELFSPLIRVITAKYTYTKGLELEINSCEDTYYDWAKLRFVRPMEQTVSIARHERITIQIGYNGSFATVFTGYAATDLTASANANELLLKDGMLLLEDVRINSTFLNTTPQEIIRYCAGLAGITQLQLSTAVYQSRACLPIIGQNGIQIIQSINTYWRIQPKFFFQDDVLYWGITAPQSKLYCFEYSKNIISLQLTDGYWELVTVSVPFVKHSQMIRVKHPNISGDFKVHRVRVSTQASGFIRTTLSFKGD